MLNAGPIPAVRRQRSARMQSMKPVVYATPEVLNGSAPVRTLVLREDAEGRRFVELSHETVAMGLQATTWERIVEIYPPAGKFNFDMPVFRQNESYGYDAYHEEWRPIGMDHETWAAAIQQRQGD